MNTNYPFSSQCVVGCDSPSIVAAPLERTPRPRPSIPRFRIEGKVGRPRFIVSDLIREFETESANAKKTGCGWVAAGF